MDTLKTLAAKARNKSELTAVLFALVLAVVGAGGVFGFSVAVFWLWGSPHAFFALLSLVGFFVGLYPAIRSGYVRDED